jgi:hypothetical protein
MVSGPVTPPDERELVFNIVWTGDVFTYLQYFVKSQIAQSDARFRFVSNGCPPDQVAMFERFAAEHPDRVVDVLDVTEASDKTMVAHGVALDRVRRVRDDGDHFCLVDPDIKANRRWVSELAGLLSESCVAVTSGKEVWSDDNLIPVGHVGVPGEFFFSQDGFVFGSPHLAIYRRAAVEETAERWGVGFGSAGPDLSDRAKKKMADMGHEYLVYDTGKIMNALLQGDGHVLVHRDLPQLVHIGGLSQYLAPVRWVTNQAGEKERDWKRFRDVSARYDVAEFTAQTLMARCEGDPGPEIPPGTDDTTRAKLELVQREVADLIERYGPRASPRQPTATRGVVSGVRRWLKRAAR